LKIFFIIVPKFCDDKMFVDAGLSVQDIRRDKIHHQDEVPYIKSAKRSDCHDAAFMFIFLLEVDVATCLFLLP